MAIKISHINKFDEDKVAKMIADFLHKDYRYYFEVKTEFESYANKDRKKVKITSKDYKDS